MPYIGDQLTRVRLEKAKKARLGDDLDAHRQFDIINPIIIAMWHTKQDFLEVFNAYVLANTHTLKCQHLC